MQRVYDLVYNVHGSQAKATLAELSQELIQLGLNADVSEAHVERLSAALNGLASRTQQVAMPAMDGMSKGVDSLGQSILSLVPVWLIIESGIEAIGKLGEKANAARDRFKEMAKEVGELRDDFRELANLSGQDAPDNALIGETIKSGMAAGMTPVETKQFMEQFRGSIPAGLQKGNITEDLAGQVAAEGMRFGTRVSMSPRTAGDLTGVLSQYAKVNSTDHAAQMLGQVAYGLNEGRGNLEPLTRGLIKTAGAVVDENDGPIGSLGELAAIYGVASTHASPDAAGTKTRKAVSALRQFKGAQGLFLEESGITATDSHMSALRKIAAPARAAAADGQPIDDFLRSNGFNDESEIIAIMEQIRDLPVIEERLEKSARISGADVRLSNTNFLEHSTAGQARKVAAAKKGNEALMGIENEQLQIAKDAAEIEMRQKGEIGGFGNNVQEWLGDWGGAKTWLGYRSTKDRWLEEKAFAKAQSARFDQLRGQGKNWVEADQAMAKDYGLSRFTKDDGTLQAELFDNMYWTDDATRRKTFSKIATDLQRGGGTAMGRPDDVLGPKFDTLIEESKKTREAIQAQTIEIKTRQASEAGSMLSGASIGAAIPGRIG